MSIYLEMEGNRINFLTHEIPQALKGDLIIYLHHTVMLRTFQWGQFTLLYSNKETLKGSLTPPLSYQTF